MIKAFGIFEKNTGMPESAEIVELFLNCLKQIKQGSYFLEIKEEQLNDDELYNLIDKNKKNDGQYYFRGKYCNRQEIEDLIGNNYKKLVIEIRENQIRPIVNLGEIKVEEIK